VAVVGHAQGEGEEEDADELVSQVLDEIGITTNAQVRWRDREGERACRCRSTGIGCHAAALVWMAMMHHSSRTIVLSSRLRVLQLVSAPEGPVAQAAAAAPQPVAALAEAAGGGGGGGAAIDEDLQARLDNLRKT
jgi:hypothetical protein